MSALISRLAQSLSEDHELLLHTHTGDALATWLGTEKDIHRFVTVLILVWRVFGFKLAFKKGQLDSSVGWVGYDVATNAEAQTAQVSVKKDFVDELLADIAEF